MDIEELALRMKMVTYAQAYLNSMGRTTAHKDAIAELWMLPQHRFLFRDVIMFHRVREWCDYSLNLREQPAWYVEGDIDADW